MWHLLHLLARPVEALLGLFCVVSAIVLYPDEEGKIQSKFEDFWVRVNDFQNLALTRHAAFMTQVAKLEARLLDRIFGSQLISLQFVFVSTCFSLASVDNCGVSDVVAVDLRRFECSNWRTSPSVCPFLLQPLNTCYCILLVKESDSPFTSPHALCHIVRSIHNPDDWGV
jgi:hypothetical protein